MFARLREILADPVLSDYERWSELCALINAWDDAEERAQAIAYVDAHLTIPAPERYMYRFAPTERCWPLVRKLRLDQDTFDEFDEATLEQIDFSHITIVESISYQKRENVDELARFTGLEKLSLYGCWALKSLQGVEAIESLRSLELSHGNMSENRLFPEAVFALDRLPQLREIMINGFFEPQRMFWLTSLPWLESLRLHLHDGYLSDLGFLSALPRLKKLYLSGMLEVVELSSITSVVSTQLESLALRGCKRLVSLAGLETLGQLKELHLHDSNELRSLDGIGECTQLERLDLADVARLSGINALAELSLLRELRISEAPKLKDASPLAALKALRTCHIGKCRGIKDLSPLAALTELEELSVSCRHQTELSALSPLVGLRALRLSDCGKLQQVDGLAPLVGLQELALDDCKALSSIEGLLPLQGLRKLILKGCKSLDDIEVIGELQGLRYVSLYYSRSFKDVTPLCRLPLLNDLNLTGCSGVKKSLRSHHRGEKQISEWRSKALPKSKLPLKSPTRGAAEHLLWPDAVDNTAPDEDDFALEDYKPPTKLNEAEALAAFGNRVLPLLKRVPKQKSGAAKAAIRALGLIGTPEALEVLTEYREDTRKAPIVELLRATAGFEDPDAASALLLSDIDVTSLKLSSAGLADISCLAYMTSLEELDLSQNREISDLSPLSSLAHLRDLDLAVCSSVSDLSPLSSLHALEKLRLYWMPASDLSPLSSLPSLHELHIHSLYHLQDLSPLVEMPSLQTLHLTMCERIESFGPLGQCQQLSTLHIDPHAPGASLAPLEGLASLRSLNLEASDNLADIERLANLQQLTSLRVFGLSQRCHPETIERLIEAVSTLTQLKNLDLSNLESLTDLSALAPLVDVESLSLFFLHRLRDETIPAFPRLKTIDLNVCRSIRSLDFLKQMPDLTTLRLNSCGALTDISALAALPQLRSLSIRSCLNIEGIELVESLTQLEEVDVD